MHAQKAATMDPKHTLTVILNGDLSTRCQVNFYEHTSTRDIIQECIEHLQLPSVGKYLLYDAQGGPIDNDDIDLLQSDEPLFLSKGEAFIKSNSLALYQELSTLGRGGFGTVKLYQHTLSKRKYAIKFVNIARIETTAELTRIYKEIETLRSLTHPNIVKVEDSFTLDKHLCFVMEYCMGGELRRYLESTGPLPSDQVFSIAIQIVDAIQYCHNARVIHRDLKLENILFADAMHVRIKIVDFGISGMLTVSGQGDSSNAGSLLYLAPEVLSGADNTSSPALDIWSIGCILYYLLAGVHPFAAATSRESVKSILSGRYPPLPASVLPPWKRLLRGILRKNPSHRWNLYRIGEFLHKWRSETDYSQLPPDSEEESKEEVKHLTKSKTLRRATIGVDEGAPPNTPAGAFQRAVRDGLKKKPGPQPGWSR